MITIFRQDETSHTNCEITQNILKKKMRQKSKQNDIMNFKNIPPTTHQ